MGSKSNRKNYSFPKSENLHESHELRHFGDGYFLGGYKFRAKMKISHLEATKMYDILLKVALLFIQSQSIVNLSQDVKQAISLDYVTFLKANSILKFIAKTF